MRDIKELIYAAVEENAVKFQELVNAQLQVRAYDAIEALRPEVGASMFGEAKKMKDEEEEEIEDEDEKKSEVDEELKGNQHKIDKNKNGKIDAHDFKLLRKEEAELDEADEKQVGKEIKVARLKKDSSDFMARRTDLFPRSATSLTKHLAKKDDEKYGEAMKKVKDTPVSKFLQKRKGDGKIRTEEVVNEVAMPQNQADWQALITHQIKTAGHPVATDAQFRATHGKDTSKIASQEPPEDKMNYAAAQGGTVKQ
jgi:hypothetical protein